MVVVMSPDATDEDIARVVERVEGVGGEAFVSKGVLRTIIGLVGDIESFHHLNLRTLRGVADAQSRLAASEAMTASLDAAFCLRAAICASFFAWAFDMGGRSSAAC